MNGDGIIVRDLTNLAENISKNEKKPVYAENVESQQKNLDVRRVVSVLREPEIKVV